MLWCSSDVAFHNACLETAHGGAYNAIASVLQTVCSQVVFCLVYRMSRLFFSVCLSVGLLFKWLYGPCCVNKYDWLIDALHLLQSCASSRPKQQAARSEKHAVYRSHHSASSITMSLCMCLYLTWSLACFKQARHSYRPVTAAASSPYCLARQYYWHTGLKTCLN